jgi:hypothetical protein
MIFHVSVEAEDPRRVAKVVAELWEGAAAPLDRLVEGGWIAFSGHSDAALEVFPLGTDITEADGYKPWIGPRHGSARPTATHVAMGTRLTDEAVLQIAAREGWRAKRVMRGDRFGVIEIWIGEHFVMEWLTPEMQAPYLKTIEYMLRNEVVKGAPA